MTYDAVLCCVFGVDFSESSWEGMPIPSASAVCKFSLPDISSAFSGPFKQRINNAWRPVTPQITPDPYSVSTRIVAGGGNIQILQMKKVKSNMKLV